MVYLYTLYVHGCLLECIIVEIYPKMSEELQGAAPQAGKTEVAVLKEGFEGASIPTEAKMSEELQGAAPQAGKTEVAVLKEGFEGASIPTEAKMSEELQGAAPQAGKTEVAVLKEGFEGASIPTEATKPEATEERKEVAVKSEDIPSPLQNATQLYESLSDDVSPTKEAVILMFS